MPCTDTIRLKAHDPNDGYPREVALSDLPVSTYFGKRSFLWHLIEQLRYQICCLQSCCSTADEALSTAEQALALAQEAYDLAMAGGGTGTSPDPMKPQTMYMPDGVVTNPSSSTILSTKLLYIQRTITSQIDIDSIGFYLNTGAAGHTARIGLYESTADGVPGDLIVQGEVFLDTTGFKTVAVSETLPPGRYFLGAGFSTNANIRLYTSTTFDANVHGLEIGTLNRVTHYSESYDPVLHPPLPSTAGSVTKETGSLPGLFITTV